jgi:hypothetical protein
VVHKGALTDCCWIQGEHTAYEFHWGPDSGPSPMESTYLVASFANLERIVLPRSGQSTGAKLTYAKKVLIPNGTHYYLFETEKRLCLALDQPKIALDAVKPQPGQEAACEEIVRLARQHRLAYVHVLHRDVKFTIPEECVLEGALEEKVSMILGWRPACQEQFDHEQRLRHCFEADCRRMKMWDIVHKDDQQELENVMWARYEAITDIFHIVAGRSSAFPNIRQLDIYDFFEDVHLLPKQDFSQNDDEDDFEPLFPFMTLIDLQQCVKQTMASGKEDAELLKKKKKPRMAVAKTVDHNIRPSWRVSDGNSAGAIKLRSVMKSLTAKEAEGMPLNRSMFIEMLVRVAVFLHARDLKDHPHYSIMSVPKMLAHFIDEGIAGSLYKPPLAPFPRTFLWTSEVQNAFHNHTRTLRDLHRSFGASMQGMLRLAQLSHLYGRDFTAKHVRSVFAMSKTLEQESSTDTSSALLTYPEFLECVARCSIVHLTARKSALLFNLPLRPPEEARPDEDPGRKAQRLAVMCQCVEAMLEKLESKLRLGKLA